MTDDIELPDDPIADPDEDADPDVANDPIPEDDASVPQEVPQE